MTTITRDLGFCTLIVVDNEESNQLERWREACKKLVMAVARKRNERGLKTPSDEELYLNDDELEQLKHVKKSMLHPEIIQYLKERFSDYE